MSTYRGVCSGSLRVVVILLCLATSLIASGQVEQGQFVGRITDPSGAIIPGAQVQARNVETNITYKAVTNGTGDYVITLTARGFQQAATKPVELQVGQIARVDVPLTIGTTTTVVNVNTAAPLLS